MSTATSAPPAVVAPQAPTPPEAITDVEDPASKNSGAEDDLHKLVLYRVWYDDDAAWDAFVHVLTLDANNPLHYDDDDDDEEGDDFPYTVMDDPAAYSGASKDAIRAAFRRWIGAQPAAAGVDLDRTPRYRFCLYADRDVITSANASPYHNPAYKKRGGYIIAGFAVLVDARFDDRPEDEIRESEAAEIEPDEDDLDEIAAGDFTYEEWRTRMIEMARAERSSYEPLEGRRSRDVGWAYVRLRTVYGLYRDLMVDTDKGEWHRYYKRPPLVYPDGMPMAMG